MFLLSMIACHLFTPLEITCVEGMACADDSASTDSAMDDTAGGGTPLLGMVVSVGTAGGTSVQVLDPSGARVDTRGGFGNAAGPVAADPASGRVIVASDTAILWNDGATAPQSVATTSPTLALDLLGDAARILEATTLHTVNLGTTAAPTSVAMPPDEFAASMATAADGAALVTTFSDAAHLYGSDGATLTERTRGYDASVLRTRVVAWGPDDAPCLCTAVGAVYSIDALAREDAPAPLVYADLGMQDVSACAWDPGDGSWLLFSPTTGFVRADATGRATVLAAPGANETYFHGNTWRAEDAE